MAEKKTTRRRQFGRTASIGKPNPIDVHVGVRIRLRRTLMGLSQEKLGDALGLTFQQIQKYERGANRVGSSRLFDLSRVLEVPVSYFFDDMPGEVSSQSPGQLYADRRDPNPYDVAADPMARRETLELVRAYYGITDVEARRKFYELARALASTMSGEE
ncbi:MAG: helix-turn-helix domain-containing protein [Rhodospirillaceae bacterium]|jgi:transcriptional regulator with XRE-family HTH domain|nr:helix-turn-helix domain-containing protein [Rhodospirillaceae bacterium]MBT6139362.1 helix-turn-helix domain-containing protein [Rhodospirillaceae bacterium]